MRGLTSIGAAIVLMAIAGWTFADKGVNAMSLALAAGSCVLLYRGIQGQELQTSAGDAVGTFEFVRDPGGTIVDSAYDTIGGFLKGDEKKSAEEESTFDPDAVIARYMANRGESPPSPQAEAAPVRAQFGRKGLTSGS
jgi:hypothetical protein